MWKKTSSLLFFALLGMLAKSGEIRAQVAHGNIDLQQVSHDPNNPVGMCQCDTIRVRYEIKPGANFSATSTFEYQLTNTLGSFDPPAVVINLDLVDLLVGVNPDVQATSVLDTFNTGLKWARLAIPCNAPLFGSSLRVVNRDFNGNITPGGVSDTAHYITNRIPTIAVIDSVSMLTGVGAPQDTFQNPYTTTVPDDIGICPGDSVYLSVNNDGTSYQWFNGSTQLLGEEDEFIRVHTSGQYYVEVFDGACSIYSDTVAVEVMNTPTDITFSPGSPLNSNAHQVDRTAPLDSIELCYTESAMLEGPQVPAGTGLTFTYQWLTDSLNTTTGLRDTFEIPGATNGNLILNSSNFNPGWNRYWVAVNDGYCTDTTPAPYHVIIDTVPNAEVASAPFPGFGGTVEFDEVCMTDSLNLTTVPNLPDPMWKYRWQWYDPSGTGTWRYVSGQALGDLSFDTLPRITVDTSLSDPGQPYFQSPKPALRFFRVRIHTVTSTGEETCVFFSDSIVVRWKPEDSITYDQSNLNVVEVGRDSINLCTRDSAELIASATPAALVANGYFYDYQWLVDSFDTALGRFVQVPIPGETLRRLTVHESGRYSVAIDDGICVDTVRRFHVFVDSLPSTSVVASSYPGQSVPNDRDLCLTDSIMLAATDSVLPGWDYQWQVNLGSGWNNALNDTLPWLSVDTAYRSIGVDTVWFRLATSYENRFGLMTCPDTTEPISVQFYDPPTINLEPSDSVAICEGDSVRIIATGNAQTFVWNGTDPGPTQWFTQPGVYTITGTGVNGCTTTREVIISNYQTTANAGADITTTSGSTVTLSGSGGDNYRWFAEKPLGWSDFLSQNVEVTYTLPTGVSEDSITVYLQVTNEDGCTDLDSLYLIVQSPEGAGTGLLSRAYNLFSPNNDGVNDVWNISSIVNEYNACSITVLNRWGATVYEDESFDGVWTGNNQGGNELPDGTYYYVLSCDGQVVLKNAVTIIRNN